MGAALLAALPRVAGFLESGLSTGSTATLGSRAASYTSTATLPSTSALPFTGRVGAFMAGFGTGRQEESSNPSLGIPGEAPMIRQTY